MVEPSFDGKKARREISGGACGPGGCWVVNDETGRAQAFRVEGERLVPGPRLRLVPKGSDELDAEAAEPLGGWIYVAASHGLSRRKARLRPSQFQVIRFDGKGRVEASGRLRAAIRSAPVLGRFAERPLGANGANVEGLGAQGTRLLFGFRGPNVAGDAFVLEVAAEALFGAGALRAVTHRVPLGGGQGIRGMASDGLGGQWLLAGPVNDEGSWGLVRWRPGCGIVERRPLPRRPGKAEALVRLPDGGLVVLSDGPPDGAPYRLP